MTRINTNVSSLIAQKTLARSNAELEQSLQRLSTGLKINSGKDDPAGLIASEILRSDIAATNVAISNCERANQMISTADSSLAEVGNLLIEIRALVSEAANEGAMSAEQIAANQLQVDSSLAAIDRIAQVTQFQGNRLLDGSLDFVTENVNANMLNDVQVHQANFGNLSEMAVEVDVITQATQAELTYKSNTLGEDLIMTVAGNQGSTNFSFAAGTTVDDMASAINMVSEALGVEAEVNNVVASEDMKGELTLTTTGVSGSYIQIDADTAGKDVGNYAVRYSLGGTAIATAVLGATATLNSGTKLLNVQLQTTAYTAASKALAGVSGVMTGAGAMKIVAASGNSAYNGLNIKLSVASVATGATAAKMVGSVGTANSGATWTLKVTGYTTAATAKMNAAKFMSKFNSLFGDMVSMQNVTKLVIAGNTMFSTLAGGVDGGALNAAVNLTAVAAAIDGVAGLAAAATGGGTAPPTILSQSAYYGSINSSAGSTATDEPDNYIQFIAPDGMSNIEINFVTSGLTDSLELSMVSNTATGGYSTAYYQADSANASFKITADNQGTDYDDTDIVLKQVDNLTGAVATWDKSNKKIVIAGDFTSGVSAANIKTAINNNAGISTNFTFSDIGTGAGTITGTFDSTTGTTVATTDGGNEYASITVNLGTSAGQVTTTAADVISLINNSTDMQGLGISASNAFGSDGSGLVSVGSTRFDAAGARATVGFATATTTAANGLDAALTFTAKSSGDAYDGVKVVFQDGVTQGNEYIEYNSATKQLTVNVESGVSTAANVITAMANSASSGAAALFDVATAVGGNGSGFVTSTDGAYTAGGSLISPEAGAGGTGGIHLLGNADEGDILGSRGLNIKSTGYGESAFVSVKASPQVSGQSLTFAMIDEDSNAATRATGTNADVRINGAEAVSDGLDISIYTATLNLDFTLDSDIVDGSSTTFRITGGGAQFQIGPDVISTQQARLGIPSINATELGGVSGRMYQLQSGNTASLKTDTTLAASIVEEAITQVTSLRGRLGAFQATTLDTTIETLTSAVENLTAAESSIRDTDFASESSAMTRAQILVSSGMTVLSIANQQPQNVLQLLQ